MTCNRAYIYMYMVVILNSNTYMYACERKLIMSVPIKIDGNSTTTFITHIPASTLVFTPIYDINTCT